jgi:hypothetical protein
MNRRFFVKAIFGILSLLGFGKTLEAKESSIYKYNKIIRKCDEATLDEFRNFACIKEDGTSIPVPIIWASDRQVNDNLLLVCPIGHTSNPQFEKIETDKHMEALRDRTVKVEVPPLCPPLMNLFSSDIIPADKIGIIYNLTIRTFYKEDMNQILERIIIKFHPTFTNSVGTYTLLEMCNNENDEGAVKPIIYAIRFRVDLK